MSQYNPTINVSNHPYLNRILSKEEYYIIVDEMEKLGFENGWIQELDSSDFYLPDFTLNEPFNSRKLRVESRKLTVESRKLTVESRKSKVDSRKSKVNSN